MNKTSGTITGAGQHISRSGKFLMALIIVVATAVGVLALFQPAATPAATPGAASAATTSARLLALDQSLFAVVGTSDSAAAYTGRLRAINESLYPDDRPASASSYNQRLWDLNNRLYPPDASAAASAATTNARQALKDQRIADWTEINVTQPATQGH